MNTSSKEQPHDMDSYDVIETLWKVLEELEERVMHLEAVMFGFQDSQVPQHQLSQSSQQPGSSVVDAASLKVIVERVCFPMLRRTPKPDKAQLNWMADELSHHIPGMPRKELVQEVCEFFRKSREYMNGRIDTALRNHFTSFEIESMEDVSMILEFVIQNNGFIDHVRNKASIDIEEDEAARCFVQKRVHRFVLKLARRLM